MTLRQRRLGNTGIEVSEIGLGAWQLGAFREWNGPDETESIEIVHEALSIGCTFIDTASPYADGRSEEYIGIALDGRREQAVICTKFGFWAPGYQEDHSADRIEEAVELSLRRLRTDYLDVLLVHSPPAEVTDGTKAPHYKVLQRLVDAGVLRAYGVATRTDRAEEVRRIIETTGSTVVETNFSPLRQGMRGVFSEAASAGVGLIIRTPLESGWLSGKYDVNSRLPGRSRNNWPREEVMRMASGAEEFRKLLPEGVSMPHAALRYILAHQEVSTVIPGAKSVAQLRDNVAAADATLPEETLDAIRGFGARHDLVDG